MSRWEYQPDPQEQPDEEQQLANQRDAQAAAQRLSLPETDEQNEASTERLHYIENLLRTAPLVSVSVGFADRVIAAIRGQDTDNPDYRNGLGIVLGLMISMVFLLTVIALPAYLFLLAVLSTDTEQAVNDFGTFLSDQADVIGAFIFNPPILVIFILGTLGSMTLVMFVLRFMRDLFA